MENKKKTDQQLWDWFLLLTVAQTKQANVKQTHSYIVLFDWALKAEYYCLTFHIHPFSCSLVHFSAVGIASKLTPGEEDTPWTSHQSIADLLTHCIDGFSCKQSSPQLHTIYTSAEAARTHWSGLLNNRFPCLDKASRSRNKEIWSVIYFLKK